MSLTNLKRIELASEWNSKCGERLADRWPDFVDYSARLETEGPFLLHLVNKYGSRVLDAAMGIGCESIFLAENHARVVGNEINPRFRRAARLYTRHTNASLKVTSIDWRNLGKVYAEGNFDIVLVLGNSLCLLQHSRDRRRSVMNFVAVCEKGGVVVVDERNFGYIQRYRAQILNGDFRYGGRVMYCGQTIAGYPVAIDSDCVQFAYEDVEKKVVLGYLDMYPFAEGELVDLFHQAGCTCVELYSDLSPGYDEKADFYTYVFRKD